MRSPSEAREALTKVGDVRPYCDKALISKPREYAKFIGALHERGLISLAAEQPPTVGVFTVPKKMALNVSSLIPDVPTLTSENPGAPVFLPLQLGVQWDYNHQISFSSRKQTYVQHAIAFWLQVEWRNIFVYQQ